jgi:hypothetical protein
MIGCRPPAVTVPSQPDVDATRSAEVFAAFDADHDGTAAFFHYAGEDGRVNRIGYDRDGDLEGETIVPLDDIDLSQCRHLVIILDGVTYELVREMYDAGHLRLFHPPSRVVAPYPTMTDICVQDLMFGVPVEGVEAKWFDHGKNKLAGGTSAYLAGRNEPFNRILDYRIWKLMDGVGYLWPRPVWRKDIHSLQRKFQKSLEKEFIAYMVGSAQMGTSVGRAGHREVLLWVERLVNQVMYETHGLTKVTVLGDHGHTYTRAHRVEFEDWLGKRGWNVRKSLEGPRDVVPIKFGLVTFAQFATRNRDALGRELTDHPAARIVSWGQGESVVVMDADGNEARIHQRDGRYRYEPVKGDPLQIGAALQRMPGGEDAFHDADALLEATAEMEYPAPLQRLWRAHFAQVEHPPDVLVSLASDTYTGLSSFAIRVDIESTHGGLDGDNSCTFAMTTIAPLPPLMRSRDVPRALADLLGRHWPTRE